MKSLNPKITDWHGKRVWIVGASSGIGAALARQLGKTGARLALSARREHALREIGVEEDLTIWSIRDSQPPGLPGKMSSRCLL